MQSIFERILLVIYESLQDTSLSPGLAIEVLQQLNREVGLFRLDYFRSHMRLPYAMTIMQLLLARAHPLLKEELLALLCDLSVGSGGDEEEGGGNWTFDVLLPSVLIEVEGVSDEQRGQMLASVSRDTRDGPSFATHMAAFVGDVCYAQMVARGSVG